MSDLIDRQEMIDWDTIAYLSDIRAKYDCNDEEERRYYRACSKAIDALRHMPSAQPEIIRCRDCKYNSNPPEYGNALCDKFYGMTDQMGFCHYGERWEE